MTRDSYFMILVEVSTNDISGENTYVTNHIEWKEHKIIGFKPANEFQIIRRCHNKSFVNIIFLRSRKYHTEKTRN